MEALGRLFNCNLVADAKYINMVQCEGITFCCYLAGAAGDTYTLTEAKTYAGGSAQALATITRWWTSTGDGSDVWTLHTQAAASTVVAAAAATSNAVIIEVDAVELSDGFTYVKLASTGAGLVNAFQRDLHVKRNPANLPLISA